MEKTQKAKLEHVDVEEFRKLYEDELKTFRELAKIYNVSPATIRLFAHKNGIKVRETGNIKQKEYHLVSPFKEEIKDIEKFKKLFYECVPGPEIAKQLGVGKKAVYRTIKEMGLVRPKSMMSRDFYDDSLDEEMIKMYKEGKSSPEIAKIFGITSRTVLTHLAHCGIKIRNSSECQFNITGRRVPKELENFELLYDMYAVQKMSKKDIGLSLNVDPCVIDRVLKEFGIHVRDCSESKIGLFVGEKHPNWKGGRAPLYIRVRTFFQINQACKALKRDGYQCTACGSTKKLQVHHIKHFKDIFNEILAEHEGLDVVKDKEELYQIMTKDERMNDLDNLTTLCKECHYKVHGYKHRKRDEKNEEVLQDISSDV